MLISSLSAFLVALPLALLLGVPLDPICISEALPFFVITVGFDKPLRLARAVFSHPDLYTQPSSSSTTLNPSSSSTMLFSKNKVERKMTFKPVNEVFQDAADSVGEGIVRDYAIEVAVLGVGVLSGIAGLKEFCALAALTLIVDCIALWTFYVAVMNVIVQVCHIFSFIHDVYDVNAFSVTGSSHQVDPAVSEASRCGGEGNITSPKDFNRSLWRERIRRRN